MLSTVAASLHFMIQSDHQGQILVFETLSVIHVLPSHDHDIYAAIDLRLLATLPIAVSLVLP